MDKKKVFVIIPTFNEVENIGILLDRLKVLATAIDIYDWSFVVVDDDSPDGTAKFVLSKSLPNVFVIKRKFNKGRGASGVEGFRFALKNDADVILEMDADLSHNPVFIPRLINALNDYDVVLGSRYVKGGFESGRKFRRRILSRLANSYISLIFFINIKDCNSGFRAFRKEVFDKLDLDEVQATGPDIVQEILFRVKLLGFRIGEVPVIFLERVRGKSTLTFKKIVKGYFGVLKLRWKRIKGDL